MFLHRSIYVHILSYIIIHHHLRMQLYPLDKIDANWTQTGRKLDANWTQTRRKLNSIMMQPLCDLKYIQNIISKLH